jgi:hypothetical protein
MNQCILNNNLEESSIGQKRLKSISVLGEKILKLKNEIYFNNNDALKILKFIYQKDNGDE